MYLPNTLCGPIFPEERKDKMLMMIPRKSNIISQLVFGKQNSLLPLGSVIKCSLCFTDRDKTLWFIVWILRVNSVLILLLRCTWNYKFIYNKIKHTNSARWFECRSTSSESFVTMMDKLKTFSETPSVSASRCPLDTTPLWFGLKLSDTLVCTLLIRSWYTKQ